MKYTITAGSIEAEAKNVKEARETAEEFCRDYPNKKVFVEFFRTRDGQKGFLNRDGHDITGKNWNQ